MGSQAPSARTSGGSRRTHEPTGVAARPRLGRVLVVDVHLARLRGKFLTATQSDRNPERA